MVLTLSKYACDCPDCPRKYFTPLVVEVAPYRQSSRRLQEMAKGLYRSGKPALREIETQMRKEWHAGTGKSSIARWHQESLIHDYPRPEQLPFSKVLCIDEVYDQVEGKKQPIFTCVDPIAGITVRIPVEKVDAEHLIPAMQQLRSLGADPKVIVSDLWAAYPEALQQVWPKAERQLCWFHVQQWVTRQLARLIKGYAQTLSEEQRKKLNRLRFRLLASLDKQRRFSSKQRAELAEAWELIAGTVVEEALQLRNDLREVLNQATTPREARNAFDQLRSSWPQRFKPWDWRPGEPLPEPAAGQSEGTQGLHRYLEEIMAFFLRHFEMMITYLSHPGCPRTNNHAERANRRYRAIARNRYGWGSPHGLKAFLVALQGFDSS